MRKPRIRLRRRRCGVLIALLFACAFSHAPLLFAQEAGRATVSIDSQTREIFGKTLSETGLHINLLQETPDWGTLVPALDLLLNDDGFRIAQGRLGVAGYFFRGWSLDAALGDTSLKFTTFLDRETERATLFRTGIGGVPPPSPPTVRFTNQTFPDVYVRGGRLDLFTSSSRWSLFTGRVARLTGLLGTTYDGTGGSLLGIKGNHSPPRQRYTIGFGYLRTQDEPLTAGRTLQSNNLFLLEGLYTHTDPLRFLFQTTYSLHTNLAGTDSSGMSLRFGPLYQTDRLTVEANVRRTEPGFHFVTEGTQTERDQQGVFSRAEYKLKEHLSFYGSVDYAQENLSGDPTRPETDSVRLSMGGTGRLPLTARLTTNMGWTTSTGSLGSTPIDKKSYTLFSEISRRVAQYEPFVRFRGDWTTDSHQNTGATRHGETIGLRGSPLREISFQAELERRREPGGGAGSSDSVTALRGRLSYFPPWLRVSFNGEVAYEERRQGDSLFQTALNLFSPLPYNVIFQGQFLRTQTGEEEILQTSVKLTTTLEWGKPPPSVGGIPVTGAIRGVVFYDANMNRKFDRGEKGLTGLRLYLEDKSFVETDAKGRFFIPRVVQGEHVLTLEEKRIPAHLNLLVPSSFTVVVREGEKARREFALIESASVQGQIVDPRTGRGIPDVIVRLEPAETTTVSDSDGAFTLDNINPGEYALTLDPLSLPVRAEAPEPASITIKLLPGTELSELVFNVPIRTRPILKEIE